MQTVYCISGLGADHRIFANLAVPGIDFAPLTWLTPAVDEHIETYAARMRETIPEDRPVLLGVSFGGMMAIEISKYLPAATVILVSSIRDRGQLPVWMKFCGLLHLDRLAPAGVLKRGTILTRLENYNLGVESVEEAALCQDFRRRIDRGYLKWALRVILRWQNRWQPRSFYHIHGARDRIFPLRIVEPTHIIEDGGHLMIHNRAEEIGLVLKGILEGP